MVRKLALKPDTPFYGWLEREVAQRFDFACCNTQEEFRRESRAITRAGQIKGRGERHEKDDRHRLGDRSRYVLGWSNEAKIAALEAKAKVLEDQLGRLGGEISQLQSSLKRIGDWIETLNKLDAYREFRDIDWQPMAADIAQLKEEKQRLERASDILKTLNDRLDTVLHNLEEAAKLLTEVNALTPSYNVVGNKIAQLILERHCDEAIRLLQTRFAQFHFRADMEKGIFQGILSFTQHVAGDHVGAKASAEQARDTLEPLCKSQPDNDFLAVFLSRAYAVLGDKNSALKEAQRAMALSPSAKDAVRGPGMEENLALIQMIFGENSRAISTLARLLEVPYGGYLYGGPVTPALLRLDPTWDPLRADPAFQKLCQEKQH